MKCKSSCAPNINFINLFHFSFFLKEPEFVNTTSFICHTLEPYKEGYVSVTPYTNSKYNSDIFMGKTGICNFTTKSAGKSLVC